MENHIRQVREFTGEPRTKLDSLNGVLSKLLAKYPNFSDLYAFARARQAWKRTQVKPNLKKCSENFEVCWLKSKRVRWRKIFDKGKGRRTAKSWS